jgi:hypothetical protein
MSKITESARGEMCMVRIPGHCLFHPESVVWAHGNGSAAGKGIGMKSNDLLGAYACHACHDIVDRRRPTPVGMTRTEVELCFWEGHARSLIRLIDKGLIVLKRGRMEAHSMKTLQPTLPLTAAASTEKYQCQNQSVYAEFVAAQMKYTPAQSPPSSIASPRKWMEAFGRSETRTASAFAGCRTMDFGKKIARRA